MPDLHAKRLIRQDDSADDGGSELEEFCAVAHDLAEVAFPNGAGLSGGVALWLMGNTAPAYSRYAEELRMRRSTETEEEEEEEEEQSAEQALGRQRR